MSDHEVISTPGHESLQSYEHLREQAVAEFAEIADRLPMIPFVTTELDEEENGCDTEVLPAPCIPVAHITHLGEEAPDQEVDQQSVDPGDVIDAVAEHFEVDRDKITGSNQTKMVAPARHMAMYIIKNKTNLSYPRIGELFDRRDHTTVMYAYKRIEQALKENPYTPLAKKLKAITRQIQDQYNFTSPEIVNETQRSGESVVAMTRDGLFQLPVCAIDAHQSYMLGFDTLRPPAALDWGQRSSDSRLWDKYGRAALTRTRQFRQALLEEGGPSAQERLI